MSEKTKISVVIPCYRSEGTIEYVVEKITDTLSIQADKYDYEVILVNDGSPDGTFAAIAAMARTDAHIVAIDLSRNFGQHSALMAGYTAASGDYILGLDDDGEHDPDDMFLLINKLEEGYDYVCASFPETDHSFYKKMGSKLNDWMATKFIGKPKDALFSSYYVMRRFVADEIIKSPNPHPYVGGMIVAVTKKMASVPIQMHSRRLGASGYHLHNSISLWLNGITAYSVKPLRIATVLGMLIAAIGVIMGIVVTIRKILVPEILAGYTTTTALLLLIGGLILMMLGVIGEYIGRIYILINHVPQYVIRSIVTKDTVNPAMADTEELDMATTH